MRTRLATLLDSIAASSVTVVGDIMLDEYIIGDSNRISPEAPEPVIEERGREYVPGGAANVAVNITSLGATAHLIGNVGDDDDGAVVRRRLGEYGVSDSGIISDARRPTTRKTRLIARGNQVLRVDREVTGPVDDETVERFAESIASLPADVVVVSDYAKGVVTERLVEKIVETGKKVIADPKTQDFGKYGGAFLITPNHAEICRAVGVGNIGGEALEHAGRELMTEHDIANLLVTLGSEGMLLIESGGPATHIHTRAREVFDVTGAGDTVIATVAAAVAAGASLVDACHTATIAAAIVVGKHRTATATPGEILDYAFGTSASEKIVDGTVLADRVDELKRAGRKIVFTNGCFDILHMGTHHLSQ